MLLPTAWGGGGAGPGASCGPAWRGRVSGSSLGRRVLDDSRMGRGGGQLGGSRATAKGAGEGGGVAGWGRCQGFE